MDSRGNPWCFDAGRLRQRVTFQTATTPTDGEAAPSYADYLEGVPAEVIENGGAESVKGRQVEANAGTVITIRYRDDIDPTMRVVYGTRYLNIVSAYDPTGYRTELRIMCSEVRP